MVNSTTIKKSLVLLMTTTLKITAQTSSNDGDTDNGRLYSKARCTIHISLSLYLRVLQDLRIKSMLFSCYRKNSEPISLGLALYNLTGRNFIYNDNAIRTTQIKPLVVMTTTHNIIIGTRW